MQLLDDDRPPGLQIREALYTGSSFSGHERDHLWVQDATGRFQQVSGISGLDHPGDGRAWARLDFDGDAGQDIVTVSANSPFLQLFDNRVPARAGALALRLVGGNQSPAPSTTWSSRDAIGARVVVTAGGRTLHRELRAGEGLASQSSATVWVGLGEATAAEQVEVRWPSGRRTVLAGLQAGQTITVFEDPAMNGGRSTRIDD